MDCGSSRFAEIIDNHNENLKYLRQLEATYGSLKKGQVQKFRTLLVNVVGEQFKGLLEELLTDDFSLDALLGGLQLITITNPAALGVVIEKEIERLERYFYSELELLSLIQDNLVWALAKFEEDWALLSNFNQFLFEHKKELNKFYNQKLPAAIDKISKSKGHLIVAENLLYVTNVLEDDIPFMGRLVQARQNLSSAKSYLATRSQQDPVVIFIEFEAWWQSLLSLIGRLGGVGTPSWEGVKDDLINAGGNFKQYLETLHVVAINIAETLVSLNHLEAESHDVWSKVHKNLVKNHDGVTAELAKTLYKAINVYLNTGDPQLPVVTLPAIGLPVTEVSVEEWEEQANAFKPFQKLWYDKIDEIESVLNEITVGSARNALIGLETIYSPIVDLIIDVYEALSRPLWNKLFYSVALVRGIVGQMQRGQEMATDVAEHLVIIKNNIAGIKTQVQNIITYFGDNNPVLQIQNLMGITQETKALFYGFSALADSLGFDYFSQLLNTGKFTEAVSLKPDEADVVQQLLGCLRSVEHETAEKANAAMEIQKIAAAEKLRKNKLQASFDVAVQEGIKNQEEKIAKYKVLLETYNQ